MLVAVCIIALCNDAYAWPSDADKAKDTKPKDVATTIKDAKAAKEAKKKCAKDCGTTYDPVCAHDPANPNFKPRTFGTQCAMEVVNCEMGTSKLKRKFLFLCSVSLKLKFFPAIIKSFLYERNG